MALVETTDETVSLLLLLDFRRHGGGQVDGGNLFGSFNCLIRVSKSKIGNLQVSQFVAKSKPTCANRIWIKIRASFRLALPGNTFPQKAVQYL
jgi:hypothetical protein